MDLHLQNVQTRDTVRLSPDRTLIGTADHAEYRTAGGPYLAALAVQTPAAGWSLFGLDDSGVMFNRQPLRPGERVVPKKGDLLSIGDERFTFLAPRGGPAPAPGVAPPACFAYVAYPDGQEECRAVDHDLLFGRLAQCHVQLADGRLSRLSALIAVHGNVWYVHTLSKKAIGRNRKAVTHSARLADGDELLIGPLVVRIELRSPTAEAPALPAAPGLAPGPGPFAGPTDLAESTDDAAQEPHSEPSPELAVLRAAAERLEGWLKNQQVAPAQPKGGLGGWFSAQRDRLRRFWLDTPETTAARGLRAAGKWAEAFAVLDRAIRARPDSPELLRELHRLYDAAGLLDLSYRPLRHIEKLAEARGAPDPWVLEELARVCERLSARRPSMADRAVSYWTKLETATGVSRRREKADALARRALREGGFASAADDGD